MNPVAPGTGVLFPWRSDPAPLAMALDDALLELAQEGQASLRVYSWDGPHLTLGYFQKAEVRRTLGHESLPWARRASGGEALLHHHEWTYAFALPAEHPLSSADPLTLTRLVHQGVAGWLQGLGVPARLHEEGDRYLGNCGLCFQHFSRGDLLLCDSKIMGSAQRRRKGTLLQQGGLLLKQSPVEPRLLGIADLEPAFTPANSQRAGFVNLLTQVIGGSWKTASESETRLWLERTDRWLQNHESAAWREKR